MLDVKDLYQEVIVDHNRNPRNFGELEDANHKLEGFNPLCGDRLTLYIRTNEDNIIEAIQFDGSGCAISVASASLMTEVMQGKKIDKAKQLFNEFHDVLIHDHEADMEKLGKLAVLAGVKDYPSRVKCATLCWHTLNSLLEGQEQAVCTE